MHPSTNASGKSNFLDVFRFLRDLSKPKGGGLQAAVAERDGISKLRCLHARKDTKVTLLIKGCRNPDDGIQREPTFAAAHVWRNEDDYQPNGKRGRRFLQFNKRPRRK